MRKNLMVTVLTASFVYFVIFVGLTEAKTYNWRLASIVPPGSFLGQGLTKFAEKVNQKTNGQMKIKIGFSSAYGGWADALKAVSMGSLEMTVEDVGRWEVANKNFRISSCFYAFSGWDHYIKFINSPLFKKEVKVLSKSNYHVLIPDKGAVWKRGPNRVLLSKRPVFTVADYQGLKIRTPEIKLRVRIYSSMGATPTMIPWKEAYLALKQGMVNAITAPLDHVYDMKFHEVVPYITNVNEFLQNNMITVDKRKWDRLPDNIKKAMEEAAIETVEWNNSLLDKRVEEDIQKMLDEGAFYIRVGLKSFMEKFAPLVKEFESEGLWEKGLYEKVQRLK